MLKKVALLAACLVLLLIAGVLYILQDKDARPATGESKFADNNGVRLEYFTQGETGKPLVVLLASYARSASDFNELANSLNKASFRTLAPQARGVGGSKLPSLQTTLFTYADDLAAILEAEGETGAVTIIGHAFGNRVARAFASRYPDKVERLILVAAGDGAPPDNVRDAIAVIVYGLGSRQQRIEALELAFFAPGNKVPEYWLDGWYPLAGLAQGGAVARTPKDQWIAAGGLPMLVIQPGQDAAAPDGAKKLKRRFSERVQVIELPNAGHAVLPEQPEALADLIIASLRARTVRY